MTIRLKNLEQQTMVITGATSGIGLTTARRAARAGTQLVLVARSSDALDELAHELRGKGAQVATVAADVGNEADVARITRTAVEHFGRIDTWVNNAGASVYGRIDEVDTEDMRRVFDTNFWGIVYGSLEAVKHFKSRSGPGALINLGSEASDVALPLQGIYSASKHAVKGFTNALRLELEKERAPISVTLIKPASIDTMFPQHAKNYMDEEPTLPPPVYAPDLVADAILQCAQRSKTEVFVGGGAKANSAGSYHAPRMFDRLMRLTIFGMQKSGRPTAPHRRDALHATNPDTELRERGGVARKVYEHSAYTAASLRSSPLPSPLTSLAIGGVLLAAWNMTQRANREPAQSPL